jgi:hypothetical protein
MILCIAQNNAFKKKKKKKTTPGVQLQMTTISTV